jgi:outer membrane protein assembly factor BamB
VVWKSLIPGRGHSSPIIHDQQVFLTTADEPERTQSVLCYDKQTGKLLWSVPVHRGGFMPMHAKNSQASATPACDGERLYCAFLHQGALWVTAIDLKGNLVWQTEAGPFLSEHGYGSSPALYQSLVLVLGDNQGISFLTALHRKTGQLIWRVKRPQGASYGTPIVARIAGREQLLVGGHNVVSSYDPGTGQLLWHCTGPSQVTANSIAFDQEFVFASGGYPEKEVMCIRGDGVGDVSSTHVVWRSQRGAAYVPSPLAHAGLLYLAQDDSGMVSCVRADSGELVWKERLSRRFTSSPLLAGGYLSSEEGKTHGRAGRARQHPGQVVQPRQRVGGTQ